MRSRSKDASEKRFLLPKCDIVSNGERKKNVINVVLADCARDLFFLMCINHRCQHQMQVTLLDPWVKLKKIAQNAMAARTFRHVQLEEKTFVLIAYTATFKENSFFRNDAISHSHSACIDPASEIGHCLFAPDISFIEWDL